MPSQSCTQYLSLFDEAKAPTKVGRYFIMNNPGVLDGRGCIIRDYSAE